MTSDSGDRSAPTHAVLLIGGLGTRLRPLTDTIPKALIDVHGKPVTEHLIDLLKKYNVRNVLLSVGYLKEKVREYFGDGSAYGVSISYLEEDEALGTAGPLLLAKSHLNSTFIAGNGDELKDLDIGKMYAFHKKHGGKATLALRSVEDPSAYGVARMDGDKIVEFVEKPKKEEAPSNLINAGFYILEPSILELVKPGFCMLEKDVFPKLASEGSLFGFTFDGQWYDIGTHERYATAKNEWKGISE